MKENNNALKYTVRGEISEVDSENKVITVIKGKNTDEINIGDFIEDVQNWFAERTEGDEIDFTLIAKQIKK